MGSFSNTGRPAAQHDRCAQCQAPFEQRTGPGRRKEYCSRSCRRRAQRQRDGQRASVPLATLPWGRDIAEYLQALAARLVDAEHERAPLQVLLEHAERLAKEITYYRAAAVQDARTAGCGWEVVAAAACAEVETVRSRWGESALKRLFARRAREQRMADPSGRQVPGQTGSATQSVAQAPCPARQFAAAMAQMQRTSRVSLEEAARQADLSPSYLSRILSGKRLPSWPVTHMLASIFQASPADVRYLWESAHGLGGTRRRSLAGAADRLCAALRGLHLAAGCPSAARLGASAGGLSAVTVTEVLRGQHVPDWELLARLVSALHGRPADIQPLWEELHYAFLVAQDAFPPGGLARTKLPAPSEALDED
ncbi:helix-turn-helix transcriptional regulator [Streptomyces chrestomyceticus]|uniref:helix-turn-helix transcriptional regulator n=1 Tax=Streptomyces chrestomyceticus TaxID=68185 RepID=UPI0033DC1EB8